MKVRFALRAGTEDVHQQLDHTLSRLDLGNASDYARFLNFHARTVPALEGALESAGLGELLDGWRQSRRSPAIVADLAALGQQAPAPAKFPKVAGTAPVLGTAYVLEGSRLGGRVLRDQVGAGLPATFLDDGHGLGAWPGLITLLDRLLCSESLIAEAKDAARRCFSWFLVEAREARIG
jgi:heme oxygenase